MTTKRQRKIENNSLHDIDWKIEKNYSRNINEILKISRNQYMDS